MRKIYIPGKLIVSRRQAKGLTQAQLAEELGIDVSTFCRIENELVAPDVENLDKIAQWLGITITLGKQNPSYEVTVELETLHQKLTRIQEILGE